MNLWNDPYTCWTISSIVLYACAPGKFQVSVGLALNPLKNIVTVPFVISLDFWYTISIYIYSPTLCKALYIKFVYNTLLLSTHNNTVIPMQGPNHLSYEVTVFARKEWWVKEMFVQCAWLKDDSKK